MFFSDRTRSVEEGRRKTETKNLPTRGKCVKRRRKFLPRGEGVEKEAKVSMEIRGREEMETTTSSIYDPESEIGTSEGLLGGPERRDLWVRSHVKRA